MHNVEQFIVSTTHESDRRHENQHHGNARRITSILSGLEEDEFGMLGEKALRVDAVYERFKSDTKNQKIDETMHQTHLACSTT